MMLIYDKCKPAIPFHSPDVQHAHIPRNDDMYIQGISMTPVLMECSFCTTQKLVFTTRSQYASIMDVPGRCAFLGDPHSPLT
jgi:hypothetical protein